MVAGAQCSRDGAGSHGRALEQGDLLPDLARQPEVSVSISLTAASMTVVEVLNEDAAILLISERISLQ